MSTRFTAPILPAALLLALAACNSDQAAPEPEGWLSATIQGASPASFQGSGYFHSTRDIPSWPTEAPHFFYIYSEGTGASAGAGFTLTRSRGEHPQVGRFPLGRSQGDAFEWNLTYTVERGDSIAIFGALDGELEVTRSSSDVIAGRFSFTAAGGVVCSKEWESRREEDGVPVLPCSYPTGPDLPTVEVKGSFNVIPDRRCESPADKASAAGIPRPFVMYCVN